MRVCVCVCVCEVLSSCDPDWVTDKLYMELSQKKSNAWLSYRNAAKQGYEVKSHREEYKHFCKLTKEAAEKARNAWWTARAVEAERCAWVADQAWTSGPSYVRHLQVHLYIHKGWQKHMQSVLKLEIGDLGW